MINGDYSWLKMSLGNSDSLLHSLMVKHMP